MQICKLSYLIRQEKISYRDNDGSDVGNTITLSQSEMNSAPVMYSTAIDGKNS